MRDITQVLTGNVFVMTIFMDNPKTSYKIYGQNMFYLLFVIIFTTNSSLYITVFYKMGKHGACNFAKHIRFVLVTM